MDKKTLMLAASVFAFLAVVGLASGKLSGTATAEASSAGIAVNQQGAPEQGVMTADASAMPVEIASPATTRMPQSSEQSGSAGQKNQVEPLLMAEQGEAAHADYATGADLGGSDEGEDSED